MESGDRSGGVRQSRSDQTFRLRRNTATPTDLNFPLFTPIFYLLTPIWTKHNPPLAPTTNGGPTPGSDFPILLPLAFFDYRWIPVMLGEINQETRGNSGICQSLKHRLHADSCSGLYQNFSRVAHHSEVCFVFGFFRSSRGFNVDWFPYGAGMRMNLNL